MADVGSSSSLCISIFGLSAQAVAASFPLIVQIPPAASITPIAITLVAPSSTASPVQIRTGERTFFRRPDNVTPSNSVDGTQQIRDIATLGYTWRGAGARLLRQRIGTKTSLDAADKRLEVQGPIRPAAEWFVADINRTWTTPHPALIGHLTSGYDFVRPDRLDRHSWPG